MIQEDSAGPGTTWYHLYLIVLGSYAGAQLLVTALLRVPLFRRQADKCSSWSIIRFIFWLHQVILDLHGTARIICRKAFLDIVGVDLNLSVEKFDCHDVVIFSEVSK